VIEPHSISPDGVGEVGTIAVKEIDAPADGLRRSNSINGSTVGLALLAVAFGIALLGISGPVTYGFPLVAVLVTAIYVVRGRPEYGLEFVLWLWVATPGLRRVSDWAAGEFSSSNPILVVPAVCSLVLTIALLSPGRRWATAIRYGFLVIALAGAYGAIAGFAQIGPVPAAISSLLWFAPLGLGALLAGDTSRHREYVRALRRFASVALLVLGSYAIIQWVVAPPWDSFWLEQVTPTSDQFGRPEPFGIRSFSLMNSPFVFAHMLVWLVASQMATRTTAGRCGVVLGIVALGLTGIRAAWITLALVLVVLALLRRVRVTTVVGLALAVIISVVAFEPVQTAVVGRLETAGSAATDVSLTARLDKYSTSLPDMLTDPVGKGLGSTGSGGRAAESSSSATENDVIDSSYLEIWRSVGALLGSIVISAVICLAVAAFTRGRLLPHPYPYWAAMALVIPIDMLLGNVVNGPASVATWLLVGACVSATGGRASAARETGICRSAEVG
jgi:hypothetical protein